MTADEFADLLNRFGTDSVAWPSSSRNEAIRYARVSDEGRRLLAESIAFDGMLADSAHVPLAFRLRARILERIATNESPAWWSWITHGMWRPALLALVPLAFGFVIGNMTLEEDGGSTDASIFLAFTDLENFVELNESVAIDD